MNINDFSNTAVFTFAKRNDEVWLVIKTIDELMSWYEYITKNHNTLSLSKNLEKELGSERLHHITPMQILISSYAERNKKTLLTAYPEFYNQIIFKDKAKKIEEGYTVFINSKGGYHYSKEIDPDYTIFTSFDLDNFNTTINNNYIEIKRTKRRIYCNVGEHFSSILKVLREEFDDSTIEEEMNRFIENEIIIHSEYNITNKNSVKEDLQKLN